MFFFFLVCWEGGGGGGKDINDNMKIVTKRLIQKRNPDHHQILNCTSYVDLKNGISILFTNTRILAGFAICPQGGKKIDML